MIKYHHKKQLILQAKCRFCRQQDINVKFYRLVFDLIKSNTNFDWLIGMNKI